MLLRRDGVGAGVLEGGDFRGQKGADSHADKDEQILCGGDHLPKSAALEEVNDDGRLGAAERDGIGAVVAIGIGIVGSVNVIVVIGRGGGGLAGGRPSDDEVLARDAPPDEGVQPPNRQKELLTQLLRRAARREGPTSAAGPTPASPRRAAVLLVLLRRHQHQVNYVWGDNYQIQKHRNVPLQRPFAVPRGPRPHSLGPNDVNLFANGDDASVEVAQRSLHLQQSRIAVGEASVKGSNIIRR